MKRFITSEKATALAIANKAAKEIDGYTQLVTDDKIGESEQLDMYVDEVWGESEGYGVFNAQGECTSIYFWKYNDEEELEESFAFHVHSMLMFYIKEQEYENYDSFRDYAYQTFEEGCLGYSQLNDIERGILDKFDDYLIDNYEGVEKYAIRVDDGGCTTEELSEYFDTVEDARTSVDANYLAKLGYENTQWKKWSAEIIDKWTGKEYVCETINL